jgi:glycine/D-amino acid oxidase-like deaminating enzyme
LGNRRIVIVGGGIIGCSIAWRLAQRGGHEVVVIERDEPVRKASWAAAGMLLPLLEPNSPLQDLAAASFRAYPAFVDELRAATGIDAELQLEEHGGSVDSRKLGRAVYEAARALGVTFTLGQAARRIYHSGSRVAGVELANHARIDGDVVVISAGAWSGELLGMPLRIPVVPVRGQMLAVEYATTRIPRIIETEHCYLVPRGQTRVLIGATLERVGFDESVTDAAINQLLACARTLVPDIAHARIVETWAGLRPGTPDDLPILGEDSRLAGLFYATGHYRNGILLAPVTARVLTDLIVTGQSEWHLDAFSITRFVVDVAHPHCDLCGGPMTGLHCRLICRQCGYERDCSDP